MAGGRGRPGAADRRAVETCASGSGRAAPHPARAGGDVVMRWLRPLGCPSAAAPRSADGAAARAAVRRCHRAGLRLPRRPQSHLQVMAGAVQGSGRGPGGPGERGARPRDTAARRPSWRRWSPAGGGRAARGVPPPACGCRGGLGRAGRAGGSRRPSTRAALGPCQDGGQTDRQTDRQTDLSPQPTTRDPRGNGGRLVWWNSVPARGAAGPGDRGGQGLAGQGRRPRSPRWCLGGREAAVFLGHVCTSSLEGVGVWRRVRGAHTPERQALC